MDGYYSSVQELDNELREIAELTTAGSNSESLIHSPNNYQNVNFESVIKDLNRRQVVKRSLIH